MPRDVPCESLSISALRTAQAQIASPMSTAMGAVGVQKRRGRFSERGCAKTAPAGVGGRHIVLQITKKMHIVWFPCAGILYVFF